MLNHRAGEVGERRAKVTRESQWRRKSTLGKQFHRTCQPQLAFRFEPRASFGQARGRSGNRRISSEADAVHHEFHRQLVRTLHCRFPVLSVSTLGRLQNQSRPDRPGHLGKVFESQHGRHRSESQGAPRRVLHQSETFWRARPRSLPG